MHIKDNFGELLGSNNKVERSIKLAKIIKFLAYKNKKKKLAKKKRDETPKLNEYRKHFKEFNKELELRLKGDL